MHAPAPRISVIVPVRDDEDRLRACLRALEGQTVEEPFEVLVVDNGSARAPDVGACARARLLREPRPGSYAARNAGVGQARGDVLAFTDSDCVPDRDWLRNGLRALAERTFAGGRVDTFAADPVRPRPVEAYDLVHAFPQELYVSQGFAVTANLLVRRADFLAAGPFDPELESGGDMEWGQRARDAGLQPVYAADAAVAHPARRSFGELRRKLRRVAAGHAVLRARSGERLDARATLRRVLRPPAREAVRGLREPWPLRTRAGYAVVVVGVHYLRTLEPLRLELRRRWSRR